MVNYGYFFFFILFQKLFNPFYQLLNDNVNRTFSRKIFGRYGNFIPLFFLDLLFITKQIYFINYSTLLH